MDETDWTAEGPKISSEEALEAVRVLVERQVIIVERGYLCGSRAPDRRFFGDFADFSDWLKTLGPGDAVRVWGYDDNCRDDNSVVAGKMPDAQDRVPRGGAY